MPGSVSWVLLVAEFSAAPGPVATTDFYHLRLSTIGGAPCEADLSVLVTPLATGAGELVVLIGQVVPDNVANALDAAFPALVDVVRDLRGKCLSLLWIGVRPDGRFEFINPAGAGPRRHLVAPLLTSSSPGSIEALRKYVPAEADLIVTYLRSQAFR